MDGHAITPRPTGHARLFELAREARRGWCAMEKRRAAKKSFAACQGKALRIKVDGGIGAILADLLGMNPAAFNGFS